MRKSFLQLLLFLGRRRTSCRLASWRGDPALQPRGQEDLPRPRGQPAGQGDGSYYGRAQGERSADHPLIDMET